MFVFLYADLPTWILTFNFFFALRINTFNFLIYTDCCKQILVRPLSRDIKAFLRKQGAPQKQDIYNRRR